MSSDVVIRTSGLGKFYPRRLSNLRMMRYLAPWPQTAGRDDFWALRDVDFELRRGEVVGLIGCNGSGKSTFLRLVAGLLEASTGTLDIRGTTAALLELGAGFNPEFTGRENIYLSGRIYGYSIEGIESIIGAVVEFADIGDHLDQPVKTYSSGMYARLAFAVAIQVNPEILLVDEILSVGDLGFQAKCFQRIEEIKEQGTSILFVSHDLNTMQMLCDRLVLLDKGRKVAEGLPKDIADIYTQQLSHQGRAAQATDNQNEAPLQPGASIDNVQLVNEEGESISHPRVGQSYRITYRVHFREAAKAPVVSLQFKTLVGLVVSDVTSAFMRMRLDDAEAGDALDVCFSWQCNFCPGPYRIGVGVAAQRDDIPIALAGMEAFCVEVISDRPSYGITHIAPLLTVEKFRT